MSHFEWTVIALILFGMVIPFWIMVILTVLVVEQNRQREKEKKVTYVHEYAKLMQTMVADLKANDGRFNGPSMVAYLRDLKEYPQYRDATLLFLEEVSITGSDKFDDVCRTELKNLETHLLGLKDD